MKILPEIRLIASTDDIEKFNYKNAGEDELSGIKVGLRSKIGGFPDSLQNLEWPICENCQKELTFFGQLDSFGVEHSLGDCGMVYVYVCKKCFVSKSFIEEN